MLKWVGGFLILAACTGIGVAKSNELKQHQDELEELKKLISLLKSELQYTKAPFAELFEKIGKKMQSPYQEWLLHLSKQLKERQVGSFWEMWCNSIEKDLKEAKLKDVEKEELKSVGKNLEYIENLELYMEQLEFHITYIRENYRSKRKLYRSMGIMGGIFLVILLL